MNPPARLEICCSPLNPPEPNQTFTEIFNEMHHFVSEKHMETAALLRYTTLRALEVFSHNEQRTLCHHFSSSLWESQVFSMRQALSLNLNGVTNTWNVHICLFTETLKRH